MVKKASDPITSSPRFPKAAIDYLNTVLQAQREILDYDRARLEQAKASPLPPKPQQVSLHPDYETFRGTGWSDLKRTGNQVPYRWMGRVATLMIYADLSSGAEIKIEGAKLRKGRYLRDLAVWIDDFPVPGEAHRTSLIGWYFTGKIPPLVSRNKPFHLLKIETSGLAKLRIGKDAPYGSVTVSEVRIDARQTPE